MFRSTKPLLFSAVLRRSRLAALYYRALGMRINPLQTIVATDLEEVGEWDFWTVRGKGTALAIRAYGFGFDDVGRRVLYMFERDEVLDNVDSEMDGPVHVLLVWTGFVPSVLALLCAQALNQSFLGAVGGGAWAYHSFASYLTMLLMYAVLAPTLTALLKAVVETPLGPLEVGNMLVECVDFLPSSVAFSYLNTLWLRAAGVGLPNNNVFSGAPTPRNASTVVLGDNVFMSNATVTGPAAIADGCLLGLKARVRPHSVLGAGVVVAAHGIVPRNHVVERQSVMLRRYDSYGGNNNSAAGLNGVTTQAAHFSGRRLSMRESDGDLGQGDLRLIRDTSGRATLKHELFPSTASHLHYVLPRLVQILVLFSLMAANMALWHWLCGTTFFTLDLVTAKAFPSGSDVSAWWAAAGIIAFFQSYTFLCLPLVMVVTKLTVLGPRWPHQDPDVYFPTTSWPCRRYFAFMGSPVWYATRNLWQPRAYGTRLQSVWLRALGSTVGSRVLLFSNGVEDYDALTIGDDAAVCHGCFTLGHIFEGRGLSFGKCELDESCTVLTDRQVWPGARLAPLSVVKGKGPPIRKAYDSKPAKQRARR